MYIVNDMPDRVDDSIIAELKETDTGTIGHFVNSAVMDSGIRGYMPGAKVCGVALTVRVTVPDSVTGHYALKLARPGDILVVERGPDQRTACYGGSSILGAKRAGVVAIIIDGVGNDMSEANAAGVPIWCRGVTPLTTQYRDLGGAINVPVSCGGVSVRPGDIVMGDENGVLVIPRDDLERILAQLREFKTFEASMRQKFEENPGLSLPDITGSSKIVEGYLAGGI